MDLVAKFFLAFSNEVVIIPLLIFGFLTQRKKENTWIIAVYILLFTMIFNALLKSIFMVHRNPNLHGDGLAFPSGHMNASVVFYGWLALAYEDWILRGLIVLLLIGIGFGLVQQGYHHVPDILGALAFGGLTLYAFKKLSMQSCFQIDMSFFGAILILMSLGMMVILHFHTGILPHVLTTFGVLCLFTMVITFYKRRFSREQ